jgi:hypothetical protein
LHGHPDRATASGEAAIEQFDSRDAQLESARTMLIVANACLDNGIHEGAARRLDRVADLATACGSLRLEEQVSAARRRLDRLDRPLHDGLDQLTTRESEVATMVSTGMTNSQIAERQRLSVRTVESHLWRTWAAKLWQPQLDAVAVQQRPHLGELAAGERPFVCADHNRVEPAIGAGRCGEQFGRLRSAWPGSAAGAADVEELGHDPAVAGDQVGGAVALPSQ